MPFQFPLEVPDSLENFSAPPVEPQDPAEQLSQLTLLDRNTITEYQNTDMPSESGVPRDSSVLPFIYQRINHPTAVSVPSIERLWTGRMDPFVQYPINMNHHSLRLMDHGKANPLRILKPHH